MESKFIIEVTGQGYGYKSHLDSGLVTALYNKVKASNTLQGIVVKKKEKAAA